MSRRIHLTLVAVAVLFGYFAFLYINNYVTPKPHGVIVFFVHGLSPELLTLSRLYEKGPKYRLALDQLEYSALIKTYSANSLIPDAASATTARATGKKTYNGMIGQNARGQRLDNLVYRAQKKGRNTGLITTGNVTDPTLAAFYAHTSDLWNQPEIAAQYMDSSQLDLLMGGGKIAFRPASEKYPLGLRQDGRDLIQEAKERKFTVVNNADELEDLPRWRARRLLALFDDAEFPFRADLNYRFPGEKRPTQHPLLSDMVRKAIELLQYRVGGYLLIVDSALIERSITQNQAKRAIGEVFDLDIAVKTARKYAGNNALILVVSGYNSGGLTLNGPNTVSLKKDTLFEKQTNALPLITWMSGPAANPVNSIEKQEWEKLKQHGVIQTNPLAPDYSQPAFLKNSKAMTTAGDSLVLASGPGAEKIHGLMENIDLFEIIDSEL